MNVLLLGGSGLLGHALLDRVPDGISVTAPPRAELDILDSVSLASAMATNRPEVVINCAGYSSVDGCEKDPQRARRLNTDAVSELARLCGREAIRLVHVSTAFVFSGDLDRAYRTTDRPGPLNVYGRSKHAGELAIAAALDDYCIVRTSWLYGRGGKNFVEDVLAQLRTRNCVRLALDQIGAPTWTMNLAAVLWQLARERHRGVFHWCDNGSINRYEFGQAIAQDAFDLGLLRSMPTIYSVLTNEFGSEAKRPTFSTLDRTGTESTLGTNAAFWRHSLRSMLQELALENRSAAEVRGVECASR